MKTTDSGLIAALRREADSDRVSAPASFDFAVMRAVRDTAPALPAARGRGIPFNVALGVATAACLVLGAVLGAHTMGRQLDTIRAAGETLGGVAETAGRLAHSVRPPALPSLPRLLS